MLLLGQLLTLALFAACSPGGSGATAETVAGDPTKAFPEAEGWAARTPGGRRGRIIRVTTLDPTGPGSFSEALNAPGPRIIVFEVGGVIDLDGHVVKLTEPFVSIAGQTAPSPGITFIRGAIRIATHDVVMQHIRVRPGEAGNAKQSGWEVDGISTSGADAYNVIVDHCSISWSTDENLSASGPRFGGTDWRDGTSRRITFSNNIVSEALENSTHSKGAHSRGTLVHDNVSDILIVGNLYASNMGRNPLFKGGSRGAVVNNLIHNPGGRAMNYSLLAVEWGEHPHRVGQLVVVGNVMRYGPDSRRDMGLVGFRGNGDLELYAEDNLAVDRSGQPVAHVENLSTGELRQLSQRPFWPEGLTALPAAEVSEHVLRNVGARPWDRDDVDQRIVSEARAGTGRIIDSEEEVGGYPAAAPTRKDFDPAEWDLDTMVRRDAASR